MVDAPERIWMDSFRQSGEHIVCAGGNGPLVGGQSVEYVRADLAPAAPQVSVKGLVWEDVNESYIRATGTNIEIRKKYGSWVASTVEDGYRSYLTGLVSLASAKDAAQADYEARILSAVDTTPVSVIDDPRVQRLVDLIKRAEHNVPEYYTLWHSDVRAALAAIEAQP